MKQVTGNFLTQSDQSFPHDCELYDTLQANFFLVSVIGNVAGDKAILSGCEFENGNTRRKAGFVFLRTAAHPEGEVLWFEGGNVSSGLYIKTEVTPVSAQGKEYPQAYTSRWLAAGSGTENFAWSDFRELITLPQLDARLKKLEEAASVEVDTGVGLICLWPSVTIPNNYLLCNGRALKRAAYPELFAKIGTTFNTGYINNSKSRYASPGSDEFRLPDLQGRFLVGYNATDTTFGLGAAGGEKTVTLTVDQIPPHDHTYEIWERGSKDRQRFSQKSNHDEPDKVKHQTTKTGGGKAHENLPPYYALPVVIRAK